MGYSTGRVTEIRLDASGLVEAFVTCQNDAVPQPGQYLLASDANPAEEALGTTVFIAEKSIDGFWTAPPIPPAWRPGMALNLVGPLGHGFDLPRETLRLGMVALGDTVSRLIPLVTQYQQAHRNMVLFSDLPFPHIPASMEVFPLSSLAEAMDWPDFIAIDIPLARLPDLRDVLGLQDGKSLTCPAQVLVTTPMPCTGMAKCGVCAVPARRGWKFACEDGPVFDLHQLKW